MSKRQITYLILCIVGTVVPYVQFIWFLREHGLDMRLFVDQLFANRISSFFGLDVLITTFVLWAFMIFEQPKLKIRHVWLCFLATILVGVSLGLPLYLLMRESKLEKNAGTS